MQLQREAEPMSSNNPTQRLLTALGRFERQVAKARGGAPQSEWSDECMRQLIRAVEVAIEQDWTDTIEALTETARVLQSYENVEQAHLAVPFLSDSYEIFCLMINDLLVGNKRSSVMEKWRARYMRALDDLAAAGIPLTQDEEPAPQTQLAEDGANGTETRGASVTPSGHVAEAPPFETAEGLGQTGAIEEAEDESGAGLPSMSLFDDADESAHGPFHVGDLEAALQGLDLDDTPEQAPGAEAAVDDELPHRSMLEDAVSQHGSPFDQLDGADIESVDPNLRASVEIRPAGDARIEGAGSTVSDLAVPLGASEPADETRDETSEHPPGELVDELSGEVIEEPLDVGALESQGGSQDEVFEGSRETIGDEPVTEAPGALPVSEDPAGPPEPGAPAEPSSISGQLDLWCDGLARMEKAEEPAAFEEASANLREALSALERYAGEQNQPVAERVCAVMRQLRDRVPATPRIADPDFFEAAYGFCEVFAEAVKGVERPAIAQWEADAGALLAKYQLEPESAPATQTPQAGESEPSEPAETDAAAEYSQNSMVVLLERARDAIAQGSSLEAKRLALQAAAEIAREEAAQAEARLKKAEQRLRESNEAIARAHEDVEHAEDAVNVAADRAAKGGEAVSTWHEHVVAAQGQLGEVESRLAELDRQIQELMAKREEEAAARDAAAAKVSDEERHEQSASEELERLRGEEQKARERLEDMRQNVKTLHQKRSAIEASMERARDELARCQESLADIETTWQQLGQTKPAPPSDGDELLF